MSVIDQINNIKPGECVVYHRGFLAAETMAKDVGEAGKAAKRASDEGRAMLFQRKIPGEINVHGKIFDSFEYLAIGTKRRV